MAQLLARLAELQHVPAPELAEVRARITAAVAGENRCTVLQPVVDARTGRVAGAEALSRFTTAPDRPDLWFADAERVGLRVELELAAASDALAWLRRPDGPVVLSVNLSPRAVASPGFPRLVSAVDPARVVVEITEHAAVDDYAVLRAALAPARAAGLRLAVDDAGAGYASLRHVLQLHPDLVKVDTSLVRGIDADPAQQALVACLVAFARAIGGCLVAEGVETQAEYDTVARLGVQLVQGHLLARPAPGWVACSFPPARTGAPTGLAELTARLRAGRAAAAREQARSERARADSRATLARGGTSG